MSNRIALAPSVFQDEYGLSEEGGVFLGDEPSVKGHRVYNFEVEGHHNYIADGHRVHNTSVLAFLNPEQFSAVDWDTLADQDGDGYFDYVELDTIENGRAAGTTVYKMETVGGTLVARGFKTYTDEYGNLVQLQYFKDANGVINRRTIELTGAEFGEQAGRIITPFITTSLIGDDASVFDRWATDTIVGTFVENVFEFTGGYIHDQLVSGGLQNNSFEAIAEHTFGDFTDDLITNAVDNAQMLLSQWIMAEVFESLNTDSFGGKFAFLLANEGVEYLLDLTVHQIAVDVLNLNDAQINSWGLSTREFNQVFSGANLANLLFKSAIGTILPDLESQEAQIGSALITLALDIFAGIGGIWGSVFGYLGGRILDLFYDEDPQAFTEVVYSDFSGRLFLGDSWSADGGSEVISRSAASAYAEFINSFLDAASSQDNNLQSLSNSMSLVFGYYEENFRNGDGRNYALGGGDASDNGAVALAIHSRILDTLRQLDLYDGDVKFAAALAYLVNERGSGNASEILNEIATMMQVAADYQNYLEHKEFYDTLIAADPESAFSAGWAVTFLLAHQYGFTEDFIVTGRNSSGTHVTSSGDDLVRANGGNDKIFTYAGNDTLYGGRGDDRMFAGSGNDRLFGEDGNDFLNGGGGNNYLSGGAGIDEFYVGGGNDTVVGGADEDMVTFAGRFSDYSVQNLGGNNLRVTHNETGSVTQLSQVEFLLFEDQVRTYDPRYQNHIQGTVADDLLNGTSLSDAINGGPGDDTIYGFDADDFLSGDLGDDQIFGGAGDDWIFGGLGNDVAMGGAGNDNVHGQGNGDYLWGNDGNDSVRGQGGDDVIYGGRGNDTLNGGQGDDLIDGGEGEDTLLGEDGDDKLFGAGGRDSLNGGSGDDQIFGGSMGDTIIGRSGDDTIHGEHGWDRILGEWGDDVIYAGDGNDQVFGGWGDDTIYGGEGNDKILALVKSNPDAPFTYIASWANEGGAAAYNDWGADLVYAGGGNDQITATGPDIVFGGTGNDTIYASSDQWRVDGGEGFDRVIAEFTNFWDAIWYRSASGQTGAIVWANTSANTHISSHSWSLVTNVEAIQATNGKTLQQGYSYNNGFGSAAYYNPTQTGFIQLSNAEFADIFSEQAFLERRFKTFEGDWENNPPSTGFENFGAGNDTITEQSPNINLAGAQRANMGAGHDSVESGGGADFIRGQTGNDTIIAGSGNDTIDGGDGNDSLDAGSGSDSVLGGSGRDTIHAGSGSDTVRASWGEDIIYGGSGDDWLDGQQHNDEIYGESGRDTIYGGTGNDTVRGGDAPDTIFGQDGNDELHGDDGGDVIRGGNGRDTIYGGLGVDSLVGGEHDDLIYGGDAQDSIQGDAGDDTLDGGRAADNIFGGSGNDVLYGGSGNDSLRGGSGNDTLFGGSGADLLNGDTGADVASYANSTTGVSIDIGMGIGLSGDADGDTYISIERFDGSNHADRMSGGDLADIINGLDGNDTIEGHAGDDTISGNDGFDNIYGGAGNDRLSGNGASDLISGGSGNDAIFGGDGDDHLIGGTGNDRAFGGDGNDILNGSQGNDRLYGDAGRDLLIGGTGKDLLTGGSGRDQFQFGEGFGEDTITDFEIGQDKLVFEPGVHFVQYSDVSGGALARFSGGSSILFNGLTANALSSSSLFENNNAQIYQLFEAKPEDGRIYGSDRSDWMQGSDGNDELLGQKGNDILVDGSGSDRLTGGQGSDIFVMVNDGRGDRISDFDPVRDKINLTAWGVSSLASLDIWVQYESDGSWKGRGYIDFYGERIRMDGLNEQKISQISTDNFIFSGLNAYSTYSTGYSRIEVLPGQGRVIGSDRGDRIEGSDANDDIRAGKGDDYLIDGLGYDRLSGGQGSDIFVFVSDNNGDRITDFSVEKDRIDLSSWGVNSMAALNIWTEYNSDGSWKGRSYIDYYGERIRLDGIDANDVAQLTSANFIFEERPLVEGPIQSYNRLEADPSGGNVTGSMQDERIRGSNQNDTLSGGGGNDVIVDRGGSDTLRGDAGSDTFVLVADGDIDRIVDFSLADDVIDLTSWNIPSLAHLEIVPQMSDSGSWLGWSLLSFEGEQLRIDGLGAHEISQLTGANFILHGAAGPGASNSKYIRFEPQPGGSRIDGTNAAERFVGSDGYNEFRASGGNDVLVDSLGADRFSGGSGADVFVMAWDGRSDRITDFEIGRDVMDLRDWRVADISELRFWTAYNSDGSWKGRSFLDYGTERLRLDGIDANEINAFTPSDFIFVDLGLIEAQPSDGTLRGTSSGDKMVGSDEADDLRGEQGNDLLIDGAGYDRLSGGSGRDTFHLVADDSWDRISDFEVDRDVLDIREWGVTSISQLNMWTEYNSDGSWAGRSYIYYAEERLRLDGIDAAELDALNEDNFILSIESNVHQNWLDFVG